MRQSKICKNSVGRSVNKWILNQSFYGIKGRLKFYTLYEWSVSIQKMQNVCLFYKDKQHQRDCGSLWECVRVVWEKFQMEELFCIVK